MNGYYVGKVKVVGDDLMCFPARPGTFEPLACGCYDPYARSDPDPEPVETISIGEWYLRRDAQWRKMYNACDKRRRFCRPLNCIVIPHMHGS